MSVPVTDSLHVTVLDCIPLASVDILGPSQGLPGVYTFTAVHSPNNATPPFAFLWDNGDTGNTSTRLLDYGLTTLTVTAGNCSGLFVSDEYIILIGMANYLPLIARESTR